MLRTALVSVLAICALAFPDQAAAARVPVAGLTAHFADCPDYQDGGSCAQPETAEIWVAPGAGRFEFWHEVGHVFDHQSLDGRARAWLIPLLGFPAGTAWEPDGPISHAESAFGRRTPDEVFADAFAACWLRLRPGAVRRGGMRVSTWRTAYGYYPTVRQHRRVCNAIAVYELVARSAQAQTRVAQNSGL